ncbi:hypothetical protein J1614_009324 [Plenodomus biglobosus]|nr:hypothetical protein J1614_009324 [Plenodomus biglobosus]
MAPTPASDAMTAEPTSTATPHRRYWTKNNIAITIVFGLLFLALAAGLLLFYLHHRSQTKKKTLSHRHSSDQTGLLAHSDKTNMFSRHRSSSITLYLDSEPDAHRTNRSSIDTMSLIPLHLSPADGSHQEVHDPPSPPPPTAPPTATTITESTESTGTAVSKSTISSISTHSSLLRLSPVSPIPDQHTSSLRPAPRARSVSTASQRARYYESVRAEGQGVPVVTPVPIPRIVQSMDG